MTTQRGDVTCSASRPCSGPTSDTTRTSAPPSTAATNAEILERIVRIEAAVDQIQSMLGHAIRLDYTYTVREAADLMHVAEYTVRQWCRRGQVPGAVKRRTRRGNAQEWGIPGAALRRIRDDGIPPPRPRRRRGAGPLE
jgi:hypothetical protein